jgi:hypothetical protein
LPAFWVSRFHKSPSPLKRTSYIFLSEELPPFISDDPKPSRYLKNQNLKMNLKGENGMVLTGLTCLADAGCPLLLQYHGRVANRKNTAGRQEAYPYFAFLVCRGLRSCWRPSCLWFDRPYTPKQIE